ncbi:CoA-transferase family III [Hoeflea sp. IMCC20628]|uniref:CoA transferase n=1 Tax=Hoeflea sp. IMCC20628 TaxID=1620421 RepID=UPI00063BEB51|nr:CoA transferase [Hoeflea sp. IMCC20628]AKH99999.1 CoA-transferase family III [Hoeflea sp. IMCC20628]
MMSALWGALGGEPDLIDKVHVKGEGSLPSVFAVSDFAAAAIATAGSALAEWTGARSGRIPDVSVDRRLASLWFGFSIAPQGWELPPVWDAIAGDYATADGWIRLHTNAPRHRVAALSVLGTAPERDAVAAVVATLRADDLELSIVANGGCAAAMRNRQQWADHPQGRAVLAEPLMRMDMGAGAPDFAADFDVSRPLAGVKILDLTRVLAGPVATRFLAGFGADVLRVDPPAWDEGAVIPEVTPGKRCARLDLKNASDRERFKDLLAEADVLVHGYRPDALEALGLGGEVRGQLNPGLIDVSLDAYGWSGPWSGRRGFDSLVQMSCGITQAGMALGGADRPVPLPVQALDHGAGYLLAAAVMRGLTLRHKQATGSWWRTSLAGVGGFLTRYPQKPEAGGIGKPERADYADEWEQTDWGPALRLLPPIRLDNAAMGWDRPAGKLGTSAPSW